MQYFQLKMWTASQKSEWLQEHVGPYTASVYLSQAATSERLHAVHKYHALKYETQLRHCCHPSGNGPIRRDLLLFHECRLVNTPQPHLA